MKPWLIGLVAIVGSEACWLFADEAWREPSPWLLSAIVAVPLVVVVLAWSTLLSGGVRAALAIVLGCAALDVVLDLVSPYPRRFAFVAWEAARIGLVVGAAAALAKWGPPRARLLRPARAIAASSAIVAAITIATMIGIGVDGARDATEKADAALVLGYALDDDGRPRPQIIARVDHAVDLLRRGLVPRLVLSGGAAKAGHTEAQVMRDLALARGVPPDAIVLEESSRSTIENFACSASVLASIGARRVLLVTEPWHMTRAMLLARRHHVDARPSPARESPAWTSWRHAVYWLFRDANAYDRELLRQPWAAPGTCRSAACEGCRRF